MGTENPYDSYDAFDPWDDEADGTGDFSFVEDEYDSMEHYDDGFSYVPEESEIVQGAPDSTQSMPKTMVRPAYGELTREGDKVTKPQQSVLKRRRKRSRKSPEDVAGNMGYAGTSEPYRDPRYATPQTSTPARTRRRHHWGCLMPLLVVVALLAGVYWVLAHPIDERLAFSPQEQETLGGSLSWHVPGMPYYVLALGSDAREGEAYARTDTMLLIRVDLMGGKLTLLSIPRDTRVDIEGYGASKINAAYAYGGAGGAVRAVTKLTGVPISHVAVVHFEELIGLVDYLGGVTVNVPVAVSDPYTGLNISAGVQTMDGTTALAWARSRYGYALGDYQRQEDQRILLTAIVNRILSLSPREIPGALEQIGNLVGTDMRCYNLIPLFVRFRLSNPTIYSSAIPTTSAYLDNLWFEVVDDARLSRLMQVVNSGGDPNDA